jgi:hypothetical protein
VKTPAKGSAYQIISVTVVFVILVFKVQLVLFPKATKGLESISYRGALLSTLLHATVYVFVLVLIAIKCDYK